MGAPRDSLPIAGYQNGGFGSKSPGSPLRRWLRSLRSPHGPRTLRPPATPRRPMLPPPPMVAPSFDERGVGTTVATAASAPEDTRTV